MKVYSVEEIIKAEKEAVKRGISYLQLMENAGSLAAEEIIKEYPQIKRIIILCGKGNNAGDGLVTARKLAAKSVIIDIIFLCGDKLSDLCQTNLEKLPNSVKNITEDGIDWKNYDLCIDAVFGTGFRGELKEHIAEIFKQANNANLVRVAYDIPSGINCDNAEIAENTFQADLTCVFGGLKTAHTDKRVQKYCGKIAVLDIGL